VAKLKMWIGNLDGDRAGCVIASSKKRAQEIASTGRTDFDAYWKVQPAVDERLTPEILYTRPLQYGEQPPWQQGRCPIKRS
jgi:hypothetical protein